MGIRQFLLLPLLLVALSACNDGGEPAAAPARPVTAASGAPAASGAAAPAKGGGDFCALARQYGAANLAALGSDADVSPEQFRQALANLDALVAVAPPEIHDDLATVDRFEHETFDADGNVTAGMGRPDPKLQGALRHVADYLDKQCGIHM